MPPEFVFGVGLEIRRLQLRALLINGAGHDDGKLSAGNFLHRVATRFADMQQYISVHATQCLND